MFFLVIKQETHLQPKSTDTFLHIVKVIYCLKLCLIGILRRGRKGGIVRGILNISRYHFHFLFQKICLKTISCSDGFEPNNCGGEQIWRLNLCLKEKTFHEYSMALLQKECLAQWETWPVVKFFKYIKFSWLLMEKKKKNLTNSCNPTGFINSI